uniref:cell wall integrity and stress response component 4-like n=1 Tax=Ciona intestinalis TaxID=7719 RepID=UPI000EF54B2E|nr:cell wall integrity and stress response component 4-like [Ciona intestinalis]|eukprot:XP_018672592.2 cell wall integrity and stress response component 4-like [Ciona intestinalis]
MLIVLILLNLIVVTSTTGSWHQLDGIEYYIEYTVVYRVDKAKKGCKAMNAILAVVKSQRVQDFLVKNIDPTKLTVAPYSFYIGLSRTSSNTLQWSDDTTTNTSVFTYWDATDDIYDSRKLCVTMGFHAALNVLYKWKIERCSSAHRYICQRNLPTTIAPTTTTTTTTAPTTTTTVTTKQITTEGMTSKGITTTETIITSTNNSSIDNTATVNKAPTSGTSGTSVVGYAMIGVGAIVVIVICGIIYIKYYRLDYVLNNKTLH